MWVVNETIGDALKRTDPLRNVTAMSWSVTSDTESKGSTRPGTEWAWIGGNLDMDKGSFPWLTAFILLLSAVWMISKLQDVLLRFINGGTSVLLVTEWTLSCLAVLPAERAVAVAGLANESDQSLLESESQARFALLEDICLIRASTFWFKSLFFFCMHVLTSWYLPLQCVNGPGPVYEESFFFLPRFLEFDGFVFESDGSYLAELAIDNGLADNWFTRFLRVTMWPLTDLLTSLNLVSSCCSKGDVTLVKLSGSDAIRDAVWISSIDIIPFLQSFRSQDPSVPIWLCETICLHRQWRSLPWAIVIDRIVNPKSFVNDDPSRLPTSLLEWHNIQ